MSRNISEVPLLYRIDLYPDEAGIMLAGSDKRDKGMLDEYNKLAMAEVVYDTGNRNINGETIRTIIGPRAQLERFFPGYFDDSMPYIDIELSPLEISEFAQDENFRERRNDGRNGGDIFGSGTFYLDGRQIYRFPAYGNDYRTTIQSSDLSS